MPLATAMSATQDSAKPLLADLNPNGSGSDEKFLRDLVLLVASGLSLHTIANHTRKPIARIQGYLQLAEVKGLISEMQDTMSSTEMAEKMVRGALVDSVMALIRLRDKPGTKDEMVYKISTFFIRENLGANKLGLGAKDTTDMLTAELRRGTDLHSALTSDIERMLSDDPEMRGVVARATSPAASGQPFSREHSPATSMSVTTESNRGVGDAYASVAEQRCDQPVPSTSSSSEPVCLAVSDLAAKTSL